VLEGLKAEFPNATITFVPGTQFLRTDGIPVPDNADHSRRQARSEGGLQRVDGPAGQGNRSPPRACQPDEPNVNLTATICQQEVAGKKSFGVHWTGFITAPESGDYLIGVRWPRLRKTVD
jgi:beta-glucosidase